MYVNMGPVRDGERKGGERCMGVCKYRQTLLSAPRHLGMQRKSLKDQEGDIVRSGLMGIQNVALMHAYIKGL